MEIWRIALVVVLSWLLLGTLATIIPQCSARMRTKLITVSRVSLQWAVRRYKERWANPNERALRYFTSRDTDSQHLNRVYFHLIALGPFAGLYLWFVYRLRLDSSSSIR